ncbi:MULTISPECIES: N-formylglutamate amidohydrolase [unclassified Sphingomonas]|uniref:N-formylglutamate amidohydrolase n=1 Tax=unclassified Sphingomonas TaxID=196159 RepID=UPI0022B56D2A|nr:N-formylglutamate amidohydrolase [Sphingomonas sp. NIBR02145]WHU02736.1 N-formylglutamate amidohydrolase [Sphingomonas sp. NIBR02145]
MTEATFVRHGPAEPLSPVILSVPHAGRDYPEALRGAIRVPLVALRALEDRHADAIALAARRDETLFVATRARAWIDLNRAEHERDPRLDDGAWPHGAPLSAKIRSGLGLVPRRAGSAGDIWQRRLTADEVQQRIHADHRPWHAAIEAALTAARVRFGVAVLLDVHSMPSLGAPGIAARLVPGDRFGKSAAARFLGRIEGVARAHGVRTAANTPYSGGHILERHGNPRRGIHAIQLEFDRSLYLDSMLDQPGPGLEAVVRLLRDIIDAVADEALPGAIAAE